MDNSSAIHPNSSTSIHSPSALAIFDLGAGLTLGAIGQLATFVVATTIFTSKQLRTPCFELIGSGAIGSYLIAASYFGRGVYKLLEHTQNRREHSALLCMLTRVLPEIIGLGFHSLITILVGMDRVFSIAYPVKYFQIRRHIVVAVLAAAAFSLLQGLIVFFTSSMSGSTTCGNLTVVLHGLVTTLLGVFYLLDYVIIVILYSIMLISFRRRLKEHPIDSPMYLAFTRQQSAAMPTIRFMLVLYVMFGIFPGIMVNIILNSDSAESSLENTFLVLSEFCVACTSLIEFVSLTCYSQIFRECARVRFGLKPRAVVPF